MKFYFPQWQGSGYTNEIELGARTLRDYFADDSIQEIPLSDVPLVAVNHINGFDALQAQLTHFKTIIQQEKPETIFTIGGDCGLEIIPVSYLNDQLNGDLAVLWFDAHADLNIPEESPSKNFHGMPLRTLLGEGNATFTNLLFQPITDQQIFYLGLRDVDAAEQQRMEQGGIYYDAELNIENLIETIMQRGFNHIYIHFDLDSLNPAAFDWTKYQVPAGLDIDEVASGIEQLSETFQLAGFSILEATATQVEQLAPIEALLEQWRRYS